MPHRPQHHCEGGGDQQPLPDEVQERPAKALRQSAPEQVPHDVQRTLGQGARGLRKHGIPSNSGAVHGARYNARVLARRLAEHRFGMGIHRPVLEPETLIDFLTAEIADAPDLFHQRAYLARVVSVDPAGGLRDDGVQPLAHQLDSGGPNAILVTLEADGSGAIYPVLYTRVDGAVNEHPLEPDPLLRYNTAETRAAIASLVGPVLKASGITAPAP